MTDARAVSLFTTAYRPDTLHPLTPPASTGSACAVCGVRVEGSAPDWPARSGVQTLLWRRCPDCVTLAGQLAPIRDPNQQALILAADILGHAIAPVDREATCAVMHREFCTTAQTTTSEAAPGAPRRWEHLSDLESRIAQKAVNLHTERTGMPHPDGTGCGYCGQTHSLEGWRLTIATAGRRIRECSECTAADEQIPAASEQLSTRLDRIAADWKQAPAVPYVHDGTPYARTVGYVPFHLVPGAQPSRQRFAYLEQVLSRA
ncbi:hypothetical protein OG558_12720 [Kribbella sp. NBC_01510]|uniref:hypothetical protein n=1 Tax=Kribbella sp. NBC_01510 TaxID=2903581 RepID=UPI00386B6D76